MSRKLQPVILLALLACFIWSLDSFPALAQELTGSIFGTVTDATGGRLPGVSVTLSSPQMISGDEVRATGVQGTYRFPVLPPGTYTLTFELAGFQTLKREDIILLAGLSLPVDAKLHIAQVEETVTVTGESPIIDTRTSALVNTASSDTLEYIPTEREFTKIANLLPGVTDARYDFAPTNNVHGSTPRQNIYTLDGVNVDDPSTNTTVALLPVDAFQEVQMTTAGITAEFGDASGAVINYITKSGGNDLRGAANFYYQGKSTQSNNLSEEVKAAGLTRPGGFDSIYDAGFLLGGPIKSNRAWFFTNLRYLDMAEIRSDFRAPLTTDDWQWFTKGTVQVSDSNKADMSLYVRRYLNFPFTAVASFQNSEDDRTWMGVEKNNNIIIPRWTSILNPDTVFEARYSFSLFQLVASNPNEDGSPTYQDLSTGIVTGGDNHTFGDNNRNRHQLKLDLSHFRQGFGGTHNFKTGFTWEWPYVWQERFLQGARGPNELAGCDDSCISESADTYHLLFNGAPFRVRLYNSPRLQRFENRKWAFYVQDQWVVGERVTLNLGVRVDHVTGNLPESEGGGGRWEPEVKTFARQDGLIAITDVAPRFGIVWDVTGDHQTIIKGSAGRYYNQLNTGYVGIASPAGLGYLEYDWTDLNGDLVYQVGEETLLRRDTRPDPNKLPIIDPDLNNQYTDVLTIGFQRELGPEVALAVTGIFKRDGDLLGTINAAVPFSAYDPITVINPLDGQPLQVFTLRPEFLGVPGQTVLTNPGGRPGEPIELERKYDGLEIVLRKRMRDNWQLETSYVFGNGKGNVGNTFSGSQTASYTNPNNFVNRYGDLPMGPRHQFKVHGAYLAPWGLLFSGFIETLSGIPWTNNFGIIRTGAGAAVVRIFKEDFPQIQSETFIDVGGETAGSRKMDTNSRFDLRVEKKFPVGYGDISLMMDIFNVFNSGAVIRVQDLRLDNPRFGLPAQVQMPRQVRVAVKWTF